MRALRECQFVVAIVPVYVSLPRNLYTSPKPITFYLIYIIKHFRWRRFSGSGLSTARTASSNT